MLPGNPNGMIFLKVVTEDGATKTIRCEPSTTIAEIKEQFSYRCDPNEHRICFADGRVGEENKPISFYGLEQNAFIYLRNKNLSARRTSVGPRPAWADTGLQSTVLGERPFVDMEPGETEKGHMSKLRQFISHFLKRRPTPQQLVDAKILNEAPVTATNKQPNFDDINRCIEWLRKYAMHMEGLFRVSGSAQDNTTFSDKLVNHKLDIENYTADQLSPHAVTTGLKIYMREKTLPVIPYKYYKDYMENYRKGNKSAEAVKDNCQHMISSLPDNNRRILVTLCKFLKELAAFESENKMNPHNLGVVFGPTLMRTETTGMESLTECDSQIAVVEELIVHINEIDLNAVVSPSSVPSACGSGAPKKPAGPASPASAGASPSGASKTPPTMLVAPPMFSVPKSGSRPLMKSYGSLPSAAFTEAKKCATPGTPPAMPSSSPKESPKLGAIAETSQPVPPSVQTAEQPKQGPPAGAAPVPTSPAQAPQPAPTSPQGSIPPPSSPKAGSIIKPTSGGSPGSNPPVVAMPPGSRPPVGAAPTPNKPPVGHAPAPGAPGKPPMGHAPVPGSTPVHHQATGSKIKLVPKFKVNVRGAGAGAGAGAAGTPTAASAQPAAPEESVPAEGIQHDIITAISSPNDPQKAKAVASQLSNMFETNQQGTTDMLAANPAMTASLILLLGRSIAISN